jgi:hypothetical protein
VVTIAGVIGLAGVEKPAQRKAVRVGMDTKCIRQVAVMAASRGATQSQRADCRFARDQAIIRAAESNRVASMSIRVLYGTEGFLHRNDGRPGKGCERLLASLDAAKSAPFPEACVFIPLDAGSWVYHSARFGWEFH